MKKQKSGKGPTKLVRIDHKTEIEVSVDIPDDVARENYFQKLEEYKQVKKVHDKRNIGRKTSDEK